MPAASGADGRAGAGSVSVTFLGGLGDIGRNCAAIEIDGKIMLLDCGLMFPEAEMLGIDLVLPDFSWLVERSDDIVGCIITHGHEDHHGALAFALRELSFPIIGSALSLGFAANRIAAAPEPVSRSELVLAAICVVLNGLVARAWGAETVTIMNRSQGRLDLIKQLGLPFDHPQMMQLYEACDREGLLLWQDFALQWSYEEGPAFAAEACDRHLHQHDRLFALHFATTWHATYLRLRLAQAARLLRQSPLSLVQIAFATGFSSASHFARAFRGAFGNRPATGSDLPEDAGPPARPAGPAPRRR